MTVIVSKFVMGQAEAKKVSLIIHNKVADSLYVINGSNLSMFVTENDSSPFGA